MAGKRIGFFSTLSNGRKRVFCTGRSCPLKIEEMHVDKNTIAKPSMLKLEFRKVKTK